MAADLPPRTVVVFNQAGQPIKFISDENSGKLTDHLICNACGEDVIDFNPNDMATER